MHAWDYESGGGEATTASSIRPADPFASGETTEGVALVGVARRRRRSSWRRRDEPPAVDMGPLLTSEEKAKGECGL
jgi:hypothetical protein